MPWVNKFDFGLLNAFAIAQAGGGHHPLEWPGGRGVWAPNQRQTTTDPTTASVHRKGPYPPIPLRVQNTTTPHRDPGPWNWTGTLEELE